MTNFSSNTLAPSSNQSWFKGNGEICKGRIFYKIFSGGKYNYKFMFTNVIDSTFSDGSHSQANLKCDEWEILSATAMITKNISADLDNCSQKILKFGGVVSKKVIPGEIFYSDEIVLNCEKNDYICLEIEFRGYGKIPYMEETMIPTFVYCGGEWIESKLTPLCASVMCDRNVDKIIGFFGDSITEGIGVSKNSYAWWCANIAEFLGDKNSYWDIGIGFGRANDAASKGSWLNKAKMLDIVTVCFGVNDICQGYNEIEVKNNLKTIVDELNNSGVRVILFTVPPFDYDKSKEIIWRNVNCYIKEELSKIVEVYDVVSIWGCETPNEHKARYGGHPNEEGCLLLAKDFISKIKI